MFIKVCISCGIKSELKQKPKSDFCRSCTSKTRFSVPENNTMFGKRRSDILIKNNDLKNINYEDSQLFLLKRKNKIDKKVYKYRMSCNVCGVDRGYHRLVDHYRLCISCKNDKLRKKTPEHKRLRSSMKANIGGRLKQRGLSKNNLSCFSMLPYTFEDLCKHLESKFEPGMTWENYGINGWEVDHVRPDSWFHYESYEDEEFKKCWSLDNLQPMWASENRSKMNRYEG